MTVYTALLRGINVGGKNSIKMAELKKTFEALGLLNVQTYIQSGNVLFKSDEDEGALRAEIENAIESAFGFAVPVVLRTAEQMERIIRNCPFTEDEIQEAEAASGVESLYAALLPQAPSDADIEILNKYQTQDDRFVVIGRDVFLLFRHSVRDSKLAEKLNKLEVPATVRNFKTVGKLGELGRKIQY